MSAAVAVAAPATSVSTARHSYHPVVEAIREGNLPENEGAGFFLKLTLRCGAVVRGPVYGLADEVAVAGKVRIEVHKEPATAASPGTKDQTFLLDDVVKAEIEW